MAVKRFFGYIHSILGDAILIRPQADSDSIERCSLNDFESVIPSAKQPAVLSGGEQRFCFNVKDTRLSTYSHWLIEQETAPTPYVSKHRGVTSGPEKGVTVEKIARDLGIQAPGAAMPGSRLASVPYANESNNQTDPWDINSAMEAVDKDSN